MNRYLKSKPLCSKPVKGVFTGKGKYLRLQRHSIGEPLPPISEDESVFILVTGGQGSIVINGVEFQLERGSLAWLQSYHTYTIEPRFGSSLEIYACVYDYPLSSYLTFQKQTDSVSGAIMRTAPIMMVEGQRYEELLGIFDEFWEENDRHDKGSAMIKVSILGQVASFFINNCVRRTRIEQAVPRPLGWNATLYIAANFKEPLTAKSVADCYHCEPAELNRELRMISGLNFIQTLERVRVNIAAGAILFADVPFAYLISCTGFSSEASFYRTFKKRTGMSPNEYREERLSGGEYGYCGMSMSKTLMDVLNYIHKNRSEPITQKLLAKELYMSESVVVDQLKGSLGMSCSEVVALNRVRQAESLLLTTDLPLLDIAVHTGFNSAKVFTSTFRKINGVSPNDFRKQHRGEGNG